MNPNYLKSILCLILLSPSVCIKAQNINSEFERFKQEAKEEYQNFKNQAEQEYREYRDRVNAEYAEFMRKAWVKQEVSPADPVPERPEPPTPVVKEPDIKIEPIKRPLPFSNLVPVPAPKPLVRPELPSEPILPDRKSGFEFTFYGTQCEVPLDDDLKFKLKGIRENHVADAWKSLSNDMSTDLVMSCLDWRDELDLCDWGYVSFTQKMTEAYYGTDNINEARLMQMYLLVHSGYMVRIARMDDDRLVLLLPSDNHIWQYPYLIIGDYNYYLLDSEAKKKQVYLFDRKFPKEQMLSLDMDSVPDLEDRESGLKAFSSKRFPDINVNIAINPNLIDFYKDYPLSNDWDLYARASLSISAKQQLYPVLRKSIDGLGELVSAERLLNFVQTAFEYKTDGNQFGYEKPFFADETFGYDYCDCEDRSILFSILVHDLLNLDVVLVNYPGHMATAVRFNENVSGAYFDIEGHTYTVCDPTYIGAPVGDAMSQFENSSANIIQ